jgi:electron transport complex protein RnfE
MARELLGAGAFFGNKILPDGITLFVLAPGAFIVLGYLMVIFNKIKR